MPPDVPRVSAASDFELGDVDARIDGLEYGAGFLLFVRNGYMTMLEGYSYEKPWPTDLPTFKLAYRNEPRGLTFVTARS